MNFIIVYNPLDVHLSGSITELLQDLEPWDVKDCRVFDENGLEYRATAVKPKGFLTSLKTVIQPDPISSDPATLIHLLGEYLTDLDDKPSDKPMVNKLTAIYQRLTQG